MTYTPPPDPEGLVSPDEHERRLIESATELERAGLALIASSQRIEVATGNQLLVSAIRARQAAAQLARARHDQSYSTWLVNEAKKLHGLAPANARPRLRRKGNI